LIFWAFASFVLRALITQAIILIQRHNATKEIVKKGNIVFVRGRGDAYPPITSPGMEISPTMEEALLFSYFE
jgi:hypothetical protein